MPSVRSRQSDATATATSTATPRRTATAVLPDYQPPIHPLNANAQRALDTLLQTHSMKKLDNHLKCSVDLLQENAGAMNESLFYRDDDARKAANRLQQRREKDEPVDPAEEQRIEQLQEELTAMRARVEKMTKQMEDSLRKAIDSQSHVADIEASIKEITQDAITHGATQTSTQARSQRQRRNPNPDEDEDEDEEYEDFTPTDPTGGPTQATQRPAPNVAFREKLDRKRDRYQSHSLTERYAKNNDYKNFKRLVHESRYAEGEAPTMPHENTWFAEGGRPAPGVTTRQQAADDDDDDLAIAKETISTKCPLTLQEFREPVTSRKCPHSFEKEAIESMIQDPGNTARVGGTARRGDGERAVQCPVPGCTSTLTMADLHVDSLLMRKIRRIQRAIRMEEEDDEDGGGRSNVHEIESGSDDNAMDIDRFDEKPQSVKKMKLERSSRVPGSQRRGRSVVVDLDESDEDE